MQFLLIAYDRTDPEASSRRMQARPEHFERIAELKKEGKFHFGGAILDDNEQMIGSVIVYEFVNRASLDERLKEEPYITQGVWKNIEIKPFHLAKIE